MIKRLFASLMCVLLTIVLLSGTVLASWEYLFPITVADTSNTTRTYCPVLLGFGGQALLDSGKISANGTDTSMQIGDVDIGYMMNTDNVVAILPVLPSGGVVAISLYTGYSPEQTAFPIATGSGGNVTVLDNANIELGGLFTIDMYAYFNTANGTGKYIVLKPGAFSIFVSPTVAGNITASIVGGNSVTATGVSPGEHELYVMADNTTLFMYVDGVLEDSTAMGTLVSDNVTDWSLFCEDSVNYVDYFKIWRGAR